MQQVLWKKLPISGRMGHRVGHNLRPICHKLEDRGHVLCRFFAFIFDMAKKAFGLAQGEGGSVEPSRLLYDEPLLSLRSTQGLVLWAALKGAVSTNRPFIG